MERFKSMWEIRVANSLKKKQLLYSYEPRSFYISGQVRYTPDFILQNASINGKRIVLEPHGLMVPEHFRKFALFRRFFGREYFLILIVRNDLIPFVPIDAYDDVWPIEYCELLAEKLRKDMEMRTD
jgi:hypothetical protein